LPFGSLRMASYKAAVREPNHFDRDVSTIV
jgi:hypothetical protein